MLWSLWLWAAPAICDAGELFNCLAHVCLYSNLQLVRSALLAGSVMWCTLHIQVFANFLALYQWWVVSSPWTMLDDTRESYKVSNHPWAQPNSKCCTLSVYDAWYHRLIVCIIHFLWVAGDCTLLPLTEVGFSAVSCPTLAEVHFLYLKLGGKQIN